MKKHNVTICITDKQLAAMWAAIVYYSKGGMPENTRVYTALKPIAKTLACECHRRRQPEQVHEVCWRCLKRMTKKDKVSWRCSKCKAGIYANKELSPIPVE